MWTDAWWLLRLHSFFDPLELPLWEKRVDSRLVNVPTTGSKRSNSNQLKAAQQWASGIPLQQVHMHCRPFFSLTGVKTSKWCWAQWLHAHIHSSYLLDRYPLLFCHLNQHIPCHWWLKVRSCNIHKSYTYVCRSQSRGQTWEHPRCGSLQLFPIQQPDTWCHLQGLWQFCPTGAILLTWLYILVP